MSRLLSLPAELRIMVWECLIPQDKELRFVDRWHVENRDFAHGWIDFRLDAYTCTKSSLCSIDIAADVIKDSNFTSIGHDDELVWHQWVKDTLSLFQLNRQTSAEVSDMFFAGNTFAFTVDAAPEVISDDTAPLHAQWTFPAAFTESVQRVCIVQESYYHPRRFEVASMHNLLDLLVHHLTSAPHMPLGRPLVAQPLEHLHIAHVWMEFEMLHHKMPHMLEPLLGLNKRKVKKFTIGLSQHFYEGHQAHMARAMQHTTFQRKLGRALLEGLQPPLDASVQDYFSAKHDWSAIRVLREEEVIWSPGAEKWSG